MMAQLTEQCPNPSPGKTQGPSTTNDTVSQSPHLCPDRSGLFWWLLQYEVCDYNVVTDLCIYPYGLHPRGTIKLPKIVKISPVLI